MLIDVSCKPVKVVLDECPKSIIVRSVATKEADGLVRRTIEPSGSGLPNPRDRRRPRVLDIPPIVRMPRGDATWIETRLPINHILPRTSRGPRTPPPRAPVRQDNDYSELLNYNREQEPLGTGLWHRISERVQYAYEDPSDISADSPYEVVSFYKDSVSDFASTWRLMVSIEMLETNDKASKLRWFVTVHDETHSIPLVTLSIRDLQPSEDLIRETTPLQRVIRTQGRPPVLTAWDRISEDDDDDGLNF